MERRETSVVNEEPDGILHSESHVATVGRAPVAESEVVDRFTPARRIIELIYLVFGAIDAVLLIRMALKLMGANPEAGFATFIYGRTDFLLGPFHGLLPTTASGSSVFEMSVLIAILIYSLVAIGLARLVAIAFSRSRLVSRKSRSRGFTVHSS